MFSLPINNNRFYPLLTIALVICGIRAKPANAEIIFSDNFNYANGQLAGNNGGTGWASAWSGGTGATGNLVTNPLPGTVGKSVQISSSNSLLNQRTLTCSWACLAGAEKLVLIGQAMELLKLLIIHRITLTI